jgi:hypothetical protein
MRKLAILSILAVWTSYASAQSVSATSGDPAVIAAIQQTMSATDRDTARFRRVVRELSGYSAEGGTLVAFFDGTALRKLSAYLSGESGHLTQHMYFSADRLVFVHSDYEQYETRSHVEHRIYLNADQPIRRLRTQSRTNPTELVASWDPLPELLGRVKAFVACAAGAGTTCTASKDRSRPLPR